MSATELAIGMLVKLRDKGRYFSLQATEDDFADAHSLVEAFHEAYRAGTREATANEHEKQDAERQEADREKRQIAVEVESVLRRDVPDPVASILRALAMHGIVPPGGEWKVPVPEEIIPLDSSEASQLPIAEKMLSGEVPIVGALGLRTDFVPRVFQEELAREGYKPFPKFGTPEFDAKAEEVAKAQEAARARAAIAEGQLAQRFAEKWYEGGPITPGASQVPAVPND